MISHLGEQYNRASRGELNDVSVNKSQMNQRKYAIQVQNENNESIMNRSNLNVGEFDQSSIGHDATEENYEFGGDHTNDHSLDYGISRNDMYGDNSISLEDFSSDRIRVKKVPEAASMTF